MKWDNLGSTLLRHSVAVSASNLRGRWLNSAILRGFHPIQYTSISDKVKSFSDFSSNFIRFSMAEKSV